jgi:large subunit ribosomal protein L17
MRHRRKTVKLGRTAEHRNALLANQACSLIEHGRIKTTVAKAKAVRPLAEKLVTLAKRDSLHARRRAAALLHNNSERTAKAVAKLFKELGPRCASRQGGYTRIVKLGARISDSAPMAYIEWVDLPGSAESTAEPTGDTKSEKTIEKPTAKKPAKESKKADA